MRHSLILYNPHKHTNDPIANADVYVMEEGE